MEQQDKYWKDKFSKPVRPAEWNTPDDSLWDSIDRAIDDHNDKKNRGGFYWLTSSALFLLLLGGSLYFFNSYSGVDIEIDSTNTSSYKDDLEKSLDVKVIREGATPHRSAQQEIKKTSPVDLYSDDANLKNNLKELAITHSSVSNISSTTSSINEKLNAQSPISSAESLRKGAMNESSSKTQNVVINNKNLSESTILYSLNIPEKNIKAVVVNKEIQQLPDITLLPMKTPLLSVNSTDPELSRNRESNLIEPLTPQKNNPNKWGIALNAGTSYWMTRSNLAEELSSAAYYDNSSWAFNTSVLAEYKINSKWSILTGAQYTRINAESGHNASFTYDADNETTPGHNILENQSVTTPYGTYKTDINLRREGDATGIIPINSEIRSSQRISTISIPLGISYAIFSSKSLTIRPQFSVLSRYTSSVQSSIDLLNTNNTKIVFQESETLNESDNIQRWSTSIAPGINIDYSIHANMAFRLNTSYVRGLSPYFKEGTLESRQDELQMTLGIFYEF